MDTTIVDPNTPPAVDLSSLTTITPTVVEQSQASDSQALPESGTSVDSQRKAEIKKLKDSGKFKKSQALPGAPRSQLEKKLKDQGQKNGRLTDTERLGAQWGDAKLYRVAAEQFQRMNAAYKAQFGHDLVVNDAYRTYADQLAAKADAIKKGRPQYAATPGFSKHGWGLAVDLGGGVHEAGTPENNWLLDHALDFGFNHPDFADNANSFEPWHWEYVLGE